MLVDTDVIIWHMRGNLRAARALEVIGGFAVSAVTYMELVQGMRDLKELGALKAGLNDWGTQILPITEDISYRAMALVERHFHGLSLRLADALIAATAQVHDLELLTGDARHFKQLGGVTVRRFEPV